MRAQGADSFCNGSVSGVYPVGRVKAAVIPRLQRVLSWLFSQIEMPEREWASKRTVVLCRCLCLMLWVGLGLAVVAAVPLMAVLPPPFVFPIHLQGKDQRGRDYILNTLSIWMVLALAGSVVVRRMVY